MPTLNLGADVFITASPPLLRGTFQKEFTTSGAAPGMNTYVLDALSTGILLKVECNNASGTVILRLRWYSSDGGNYQVQQGLTFTSTTDTTGASQAGGDHDTFPALLAGATGLAAIPSYGMHRVRIDVVSFTGSVTACSVWVAGN